MDDPLEAAATVTLLWLFYHLPRLTALVAADFGLGMDQLFRLSGALLFTLDELCRQRLEHWPKDPDAVFPVLDAFEPVNWPWLAERAGEPDWTPPGYALCWVPLTEEERALSVAKGEEEEARWAEEERVAAADA